MKLICQHTKQARSNQLRKVQYVNETVREVICDFLISTLLLAFFCGCKDEYSESSISIVMKGPPLSSFLVTNVSLSSRSKSSAVKVPRWRSKTSELNDIL